MITFEDFFNFQEWIKDYPEFIPIDKEEVDREAEKASILFNTCCRIPPKCGDCEIKILFGLLVAHFVELKKRIKMGNQLTGVITSVRQGAVYIKTDIGRMKGIPSLLASTPYGIEFWGLSINYRNVRFIRPFPSPMLRIFP